MQHVQAGARGDVPHAGGAVLGDGEHAGAVAGHGGRVDAARVADGRVALPPALQHGQRLLPVQVPDGDGAVEEHHHRHAAVLQSARLA